MPARTIKVAALLILSLWNTHANAQSTSARRGASSESATGLIRIALQAMGGEAKLRAIRTLRTEGIGYRNALEQSERPDGPYIVEFQKVTELRDLQSKQLRRTTSNQTATYEYTETTIVSDGAVASAFNGGRLSPGQPGAEEWLMLAPERLLINALEASGLRGEPDVTLQNVPHHVLSFRWDNTPARLFLNQHTGLPTALEITRPYAYDYLSVWGDVTTRIYYSFWTLKEGGIRYPLQWNIEQNGMPSRELFLTKVEFNASLAPDSFTIPDEVKAAYRRRLEAQGQDLRLGRPDQPIREIVGGVVQIPGNFNTAIIRQDDGLIILEAPVSSAYSIKVIEEAARRFPNLPIKAAISTSDAWPHIGGVREYVARGIPVYVLDVNQPILKRLLEAPHRARPDMQAQHPRRPDFRVVSDRVVVGKGTNRMVVYPIRTETGERMMMVYFPEHRLLYASDLAQPFNNGDWIPQYLSELNDAVRRENLSVERAFAMHMTPIGWSDLIAEINRATAPKKD